MDCGIQTSLSEKHNWLQKVCKALYAFQGQEAEDKQSKPKSGSPKSLCENVKTTEGRKDSEVGHQHILFTGKMVITTQDCIGLKNKSGKYSINP